MISFDPTPSTLARIRVDDADALRFPPHSQLRSQSGQLQENANGKLLPSAEEEPLEVHWIRLPAKQKLAFDHRFEPDKKLPISLWSLY